MIAFLLIVGTAIFAAFSIALRLHFGSSAMPLGMKVLSGLSAIAYAVFVYEVLAHRSEPQYFGIALILMIASAAIFASAIAATRNKNFKLAFDEARPGDVVMSGPYKYVRHPFYTSYILFWTACAVAAPYVPNILMLVVLIVAYIFAARQEEQALLAANPESYARYQATTGAFFPRFFA